MVKSIERPPEAVFDFVADERNEPRFNPQMATSSLESGEPIGDGSRFRTTFQSVGRLVPMNGRVHRLRGDSSGRTPDGMLSLKPER
ncbi:MAG: hypothetical protein ACRDWW_03695 [Acidimicrobiales bacterium]